MGINVFFFHDRVVSVYAGNKNSPTRNISLKPFKV